MNLLWTVLKDQTNASTKKSPYKTSSKSSKHWSKLVSKSETDWHYSCCLKHHWSDSHPQYFDKDSFGLIKYQRLYKVWLRGLLLRIWRSDGSFRVSLRFTGSFGGFLLWMSYSLAFFRIWFEPLLAVRCGWTCSYLGMAGGGYLLMIGMKSLLIVVHFFQTLLKIYRVCKNFILEKLEKSLGKQVNLRWLRNLSVKMREMGMCEVEKDY